MRFFHFKRINLLLISTFVLVLNGCGDNGGSSKWLEAPNALQVVQVSAKNKALMDGTAPPDLSCEALLSSTQEKIQNPSKYHSLFKVVTDPCANAGLEYGEEIRCKSGRMQVMCL